MAQSLGQEGSLVSQGGPDPRPSRQRGCGWGGTSLGQPEQRAGWGEGVAV